MVAVCVWVLHMLHFVLFYQDEENVVSPKTMQKLLLLVLPKQGTWKIFLQGWLCTL